jgi:hypothetical protein
MRGALGWICVTLILGGFGISSAGASDVAALSALSHQQSQDAGDEAAGERERDYYRYRPAEKGTVKPCLVVSLTPALAMPVGRFYEGFNSSLGGRLDMRLWVNQEGRTEGLYFGPSLAMAGLTHEGASETATLTIISLAVGRAVSISDRGSHAYLQMGLSFLGHKGDPTSGSERLTNLDYEEGTRTGIHMRGGVTAALSERIGLDFSVCADVMRVLVTYEDIGGLTETHHYGVVWSLGVGVTYIL